MRSSVADTLSTGGLGLGAGATSNALATSLYIFKLNLPEENPSIRAKRTLDFLNNIFSTGPVIKYMH